VGTGFEKAIFTFRLVLELVDDGLKNIGDDLAIFARKSRENATFSPLFLHSRARGRTPVTAPRA